MIKTAANEKIYKGYLCGSLVHTETSGMAHGSILNDIMLLRAMRRLLNFLPLSKDRSSLPIANHGDVFEIHSTQRKYYWIFKNRR